MSVLLDTGVLYAYVAEADRDHERARALLRLVSQNRLGTPVITDLVMAEVLTLVRARRDGAKAEEHLRAVLPMPDSDIPSLYTLDVGSHAYPRVWERFALHRDRGLSFVDASHLVVMEEHSIDHLATFDQGFMGLVSMVP